ncbi:uncharacterized protein LOC100373045 [Saccoglossus kowalevskii]
MRQIIHFRRGSVHSQQQRSAAEAMEKILLTGNYTLKSMKPIDLSNTNKEEIKAYFENAFELNESIFTGLKDASAFYKCPDRLRLPLIFYYAHTASVYVNKLLLAGMIQERVDFKFETIFETGVDEMSWDDTENYRMGGSFKWPTLTEVTMYRRKVRQMVLKTIQDTPLVLPIHQESEWWALIMGIEHERIHIETSSVLIRQLPVEFVQIPRDWKYAPYSVGDGLTRNSMILVSGGDVTLGKCVKFPSFGWDNEYPEFKTTVPPFETARYLITNSEFYQFVQNGGYTKKEFWTEDGWEWKTFRQATHPAFWVCTNGCKSGCGGDISNVTHCRPNNCDDSYTSSSGSYRYRAIFSVIDMPWDWPVDVNYHEASAYCAWKGPEYRVPTEAEHHAMRGKQNASDVGVESDIIFRDDINCNINLMYGSSTPVNMYPANELGFHDITGNVWEWMADHLNGFPGTETSFLYDDFSAPLHDGKHNMMLGGSWITNGTTASKYCRTGYRRHFFQHAGFRLARSVTTDVVLPLRLINTPVFILGRGVSKIVATVKHSKIDKCFGRSTNAQYYEESESRLNNIIQLQFGVQVDNYTTNLLGVCNTIIKKYEISKNSVLHLGCGPGRMAFEMTRIFKKVVAIDFCGRYIDTALKLQNVGSLMYEIPLSCNDETVTSRKRQHAMIAGDIDRSKVVFKQMTWIPNELYGFDLTIQDMIDRVSNVKAWLVRLGEITLSTGVVVIVSSTGWDKDTIKPIVGHRLRYLGCDAFTFVTPTGEKNEAVVTLWKRT